MGKVIMLSDVSEDSRHIDPIGLVGVVEKELSDNCSELAPCNRAILLFIDTNNQCFNIHRRCSNISYSQILAALEIAKMEIMKEMGYI